MQAAVKTQAIRLKAIYGGLALTVDIVMMGTNWNLPMKDFLIIEKVFLCKLRLKVNFILMV